MAKRIQKKDLSEIFDTSQKEIALRFIRMAGRDSPDSTMRELMQALQQRRLLTVFDKMTIRSFQREISPVLEVEK